MTVSSHQLKAFTHVARCKSFSQAAIRLGVTQSAITQHVGKLERTIGTQLFVRNRDGLELTNPAIELFELTDHMFTIEETIAEKIDSYSSLNTGQLQIVATAPSPSLPLIAQYSKLFPNVRIKFSLCSWNLAMASIKRREIDIAIVTEPEKVEGLFRHELAKSRFKAYVNTEHPFAEKKTISLAELTKQPVILPEPGSLTQRIVQEHLTQSGIKLSNIAEMTTYPVVKEAILHGLGIGILLEESFYPTNHLVSLSIKEMKKEYRTFLVSPAGKQELHFIRSFIDLTEWQI